MRRQSARFKSHEREATENLFEIEVDKFPAMHEEEPVPLNSSIKKVEEEGEICMPLRSSIGRPLRKAAEKVQSYKEPPLKSKMRRVA